MHVYVFLNYSHGTLHRLYAKQGWHQSAKNYPLKRIITNYQLLQDCTKVTVSTQKSRLITMHMLYLKLVRHTHISMYIHAYTYRY